MKLFLISQNVNTGYDTYDSAVVAAENEENARKIDPSGYYYWSDDLGCWMFQYAEHTGLKPRPERYHSSWVRDLSHIKVQFLGEYAGEESKVILASFNAG